MSSHPNVVLKLTIPKDGARDGDTNTEELLHNLLEQNRVEIPNNKLPWFIDNDGDIIKNSITGKDMRISRDDDELCIGQYCYYTMIMKSNYDDEYQIYSKIGDLIIYAMEEEISRKDLESRMDALEIWAIQRGLNHYKVSVSANYW